MNHLAWDFDGTIIDSFSPYREVAQIYCERHSLVLPSDSSLKGSFGNTAWTGFVEWRMPFADQDRHRFSIYDDFYLLQKQNPESFKLIEGIADLIGNLKKGGFLQTIVTSRPKNALLAMLSYHYLLEQFEHLNTGDCATQFGLADKPAPDKLNHVLKQIGVTPEQTIVIGDTEMDIKMAINANCRPIAVTWGMGTPEILRRSGAIQVVDSVEELKNAIQKTLGLN